MEKIIVFASGSADGGGSGFENLVKATKTGELDAKIVAVVSNHKNGGVRDHARRLGIQFIHFPAPWTAERYKHRVLSSGAKWVALSGWVKFVKGLDPKCTFNIHPANLTQLNGRFGGYGMYGDNVHKAVKMALSVGELSKTGITMHFVTEDDEYDNGPIFFLQDVLIGPRMSVKQIAESVNESEHRMQPFITNLVVNGKISWDGIDKDSITYPDGYKWYPGSISC